MRDFSSLKGRAFSEQCTFTKETLRWQIRQKRKALDSRSLRYKNDKIYDNLLNLKEIDGANRIALYASLPLEAGTNSILTSLLDMHKEIVLPRVDGKDLILHKVSNLKRDLIPQGAFKIMEPDPAYCPAISSDSVDLFIIPGLGFDVFGSRVGYGVGYYDRLLSQSRADALKIALAYEFQMVHAIQLMEYDVPVDIIVTEREVYEPSQSTFITRNEEETMNLASQVVQAGLIEGDVLAIHGDLGTGKTIFVKGLAEVLNAPIEAVSPTFVYCREYHGRILLKHVDGYRLDTIPDEESLFWNELIDDNCITAIEWAEKFGNLIPYHAIHLFGHVLDASKREWILFTPLRRQKRFHSLNLTHMNGT